jgi:uroporphyrinogen III methyltransferase/synthase
MSKSDPPSLVRENQESAPLRGKTILVTRARAQSEDITAHLEALGAVVIHCPTIEVVPPSSWARLDASIGKIKEYDWIVFTSANGARFFFRRLGEMQREGVEALAAQVCAIGPATARAIETAGAVPHITACDSSGEGALRAIIDHVGGDESVRGLRFLIPQARVARETLPAGLRSLGAHVDAVETYQTVKPVVQPDHIIRLFKENSIDAITFTSPSTVSNFAEIVGLTDLSDLLGTTLVACIGPVTAMTAVSYGLGRIVQPAQHNAAELVGSIVKSIGNA